MQDNFGRGGKKEKGENGCTKRGKSNLSTLIKRQIRRPIRDDFLKPVFSVKYKDSFLKLSEDRLTVTGYKGWSSAFVTHGAEKGNWYFEAKITASAETPKFVGYSPMEMSIIKPHVRIGWACRYMRYDMPIGYNEFSYAFRDEDGSVVNGGNRLPYANVSFGEEDIIGCYISLKEPKWFLPDPRKQAKLHEFVEGGILCDPNNAPSPSINVGSTIEFAVNGKRYGVIFRDIPCSSYHPAVSLYMGAKVTINVGPYFRYPLLEGFRAVSEMPRPVFP